MNFKIIFSVVEGIYAYDAILKGSIYTNIQSFQSVCVGLILSKPHNKLYSMIHVTKLLIDWLNYLMAVSNSFH